VDATHAKCRVPAQHEEFACPIALVTMGGLSFGGDVDVADMENRASIINYSAAIGIQELHFSEGTYRGG
jgi:hypothetical protein